MQADNKNIQPDSANCYTPNKYNTIFQNSNDKLNLKEHAKCQDEHKHVNKAQEIEEVEKEKENIQYLKRKIKTRSDNKENGN